MQTMLLGLCQTLAFVSFFVFPLWAAELSEPIPLHQRPDYIIESQDVISINVKNASISAEDCKVIEGQHLIDTNGYITLGKFGRVKIQDLTMAESSEAIRFHLGKVLDADSLEIDVRVTAQNSKEYHVVFLSQRFGEQRMVFPFTGHETVVKAIQKLNPDESKQLAPDTSNNLLIIRPVSKKGKPAEFIPVDFQAIVDATVDTVVDITGSETTSSEKIDIPLKAGDTLLLSQNYQPEDLRPDSAVRVYPPIHHDGLATGPTDLATNSFAFDDTELTPPRAEMSSVERKFLRRHQDEVSAVKKRRDTEGSREKHGKRKYIARSVFFEQDAVPIDQFIHHSSPLSFPCGGVLTNLIEQVRGKVSFTIVISDAKENRVHGYWLVLFGEEAKVEELRAVFAQIAEKKLLFTGALVK